jgi:hypothetical protein
MAKQSELVPSFVDYGGLDLRSHDIDRKPRFAKDVENIELSDNNSLTCRPGQYALGLDHGGGGVKTYVRQASDKSVVEEVIGIDSNLWRRKAITLSITYSGIEENVSFSLIPVLNDDDTYTFHAYLEEGSATVLDEDLGVGINELTPVAISALITAINGVTGFAATYTGSNTTPAAFLVPTLSEPLQASVAVQVTSGMYWEQVYCPTSTPFSAFWANVNRDDFENACLFNNNNLLFIATGSGKLYKYDGLSTYAAGMPTPSGLAVASNGAGVLTGTYRYSVTFEFYDYTGNNIEGPEADEVSLSLSSNTAQCTIPTVPTSSGHLTSFGYANNAGTQTGTTLTLDDGSGGAHTLQVGMTAFFRDNAGTLQELEITARTSTSITVGTSVTIANNQAISANLRINLWRNKIGDFNKYLVRSFANRPEVSSFTYDDNIADADLGVRYTPPSGGHFMPREDIKYLTAFQNLLIMSDGNSSQVYVSDLDGPEYRNDGFDYILLRSKSNQPVSGLGANREVLAIFKSGEQGETHVVQGDLASGNIRPELASDSIGCDAHATICDIGSSLWFYSKNNGVQRIESAQKPQELSYRIVTAFRGIQTNEEQMLVHKRATAVNVARRSQYVLWIPCESETGSDLYANSNSMAYVADYRAQEEPDNDYDKDGRLRASRPKIRWWIWSGLNMAGGSDVFAGDLYWVDRRYSTDLSQFQYTHCKLNLDGDETDYSDFGQPYDVRYEAGWDDLNDPDTDKKFISVSIYSFDERSSPSFNFTCSTQLNFKNDQTHSEKEFTSDTGGTSGGWGEGPWGDFPWGEEEDNRRLFPLLLTRARSIKLVIVAAVWKFRPVVSGWVIKAVPAYTQGQKK